MTQNIVFVFLTKATGVRIFLLCLNSALTGFFGYPYLLARAKDIQKISVLLNVILVASAQITTLSYMAVHKFVQPPFDLAVTVGAGMGLSCVVYFIACIVDLCQARQSPDRLAILADNADESLVTSRTHVQIFYVVSDTQSEHDKCENCATQTHFTVLLSQTVQDFGNWEVVTLEFGVMVVLVVIPEAC